MPDRRQLVVDVKAPLDAYLAAVEASSDADRKVALERHARNVRTHVRLLAQKSYWEQFEDTPDFVILFIPGDQFLSAALTEQADLIDFALSQQIILATPTSFVALLKAVAYGWRQMHLADNAREIRVLAEDLHGRLATFVSHMNRMGRQLSSSVEAYNSAVGSLERKVLPGARKFVELGVHEKKELERLRSVEPVPRTMIEDVPDEGSDDTSGAVLQQRDAAAKAGGDGT
jgi:DNA recombination protein RmuC